jgi:hypothetical protein
MLQRALSPSESSSFLLLGPRGSGKSTLLRERFAGRSALWVDLLDPETEHRYSLQPAALREVMTPSPNPEPGLVRESSCPGWGWKGFSDEEATQYRADRRLASAG